MLVLTALVLGQRSTPYCDLTRLDDRVLFAGKIMRYLIPPVVIPILLFIGIAAYGLLRTPIVAVGHLPAAAANSQPR